VKLIDLIKSPMGFGPCPCQFKSDHR
jgi:hypothetical protein